MRITNKSKKGDKQMKTRTNIIMAILAIFVLCSTSITLLLAFSCIGTRRSKAEIRC